MAVSFHHGSTETHVQGCKKKGSANPASNADRPGVKASAGQDGATGAGLVDVFKACKLV